MYFKNISLTPFLFRAEVILNIYLMAILKTQVKAKNYCFLKHLKKLPKIRLEKFKSSIYL